MFQVYIKLYFQVDSVRWDVFVQPPFYKHKVQFLKNNLPVYHQNNLFYSHAGCGFYWASVSVYLISRLLILISVYPR